MTHAALTQADRQRIAQLNRAYLQTAIGLHRAGHDSWLLTRFDLSAEMLDELASLSPEALENLHADMSTTLFSVEVDHAALECIAMTDPLGHLLPRMQARHEQPLANLIEPFGHTNGATSTGTGLIATVLQELTACNVYSDSAAYRFNCEQRQADALTAVHPLLLPALAAHAGTVLKARFTRNHVMAADVAGAFPVGLLMSLN